jgi:hypothetical protein
MPTIRQSRRLVVGLAAALAVAAPCLAAHATAATPGPAATPGRPTLTAPIVVAVTPKVTVLKLSNAHDYVVQLPTTTAKLASGVAIIGGHNVVIDGGIISVPDPTPNEQADENDRRGLYLKNQTGTVWVHGVHMVGPLTEGIDLSEPGTTTTVVLSDIVIDPISGYTTSHHPDLIQTWGGPSRLYIDGLTGTTGYQGLFLLPNQLYHGPAPVLFSLKNIQINIANGAYALWRAPSDHYPLQLQNVDINIGPTRSASRDMLLWPKPSTGNTSWGAVNIARSSLATPVVATSSGARVAGQAVLAPRRLPNRLH